MKKILVPTDFSAIAGNAYAFAQELGRRQSAQIDVVHAYHPSFDYANPYLDLPAAEFDGMKRELLDLFVEEYSQDSGGVLAATKPLLQVGFASETLVQLSKDYDLIVMGTTGEGNLLERTFGSVSSHVSRFAHCPVLLVPGDYRFGDFTEVVFASNYQAADEAMIQELVQLTGTPPTNIHFVHVDKDKDTPYRVEQLMHEQAKIAGQEGIGYTSVEIACPDVQEGIITYASDIGADLIVMGTLHRGFLERLFHKSVTRQIVFHTTVPLLVMHYDDA